ncbi:M1 family metallopeptidase [Stakelama sp. CBK3Z-3]|uniref:M1 family metallopeptidase n=2 Tax=Stakelama flava TaxID=2860338 RepID=A0ABS6XN26_9SPHN|nr:M1 family metallopeptidase [Stakelama flava]
MLTASALAIALTACSGAAGNSAAVSQNDAPPAVAPVLDTPEAKDVHSYADPQEARVTHVSLDLAADFDAHVLRGTATLDLKTAKDADKVILDTRDLTIASVTDAKGKPLPYQVGAADPDHGAPLTIALDGAKQVKITYQTSPDAPSLQWLSPEQTAGRKYPYLFSQGEAILNRSWIPTQDSPGIRQTWDASITVPKPLTALMSAEMLTPDGVDTSGDRHTFRFRMDKPVAPYLIALAVGNLQFKATGPRTGIWTEPEMLDKAAYEFADLPKFVDAAEDLYGPYRWGRYDVLVLPPSFPFGGMENPRLTFATPTVIAGDRSLVSLVAHELAHSWSGNLVTNATWNDFWLNEGFTVYFENRIMEKLYGKRRAAMEADLGWTGMMDAVKAAGGPTSPDTQLHLNLGKDRDPDDGMTDIAYEKGAAFLRTIEKTVGRDRFDKYLRGYFDRHAFQPQTTAGFLADIKKNLLSDAEAKRIGLHQWAYEPGIPDNAVHVKSEAFPAMDMAAKEYAEGGLVASVPGDDITTQERVRFLNQLPRDLSHDRLKALDDRFDFSHAGNSEIRFAWLMLALDARYQPAVASAQAFLTSQGRRKFVAPLFSTLMNEDNWGKPIARRIYAMARPGYHSVTTGTVDRIVGWTPDQG